MARLPKSIIKKYGITKKAWRVFRGRKSKSRAVRPKTKTRGVRRLVRRYRRKRRGGGGKSMTRTAFKFIRLGALAAPAVSVIMRTDLNPEQKFRVAMQYYTGFDYRTGTFNAANLTKGWIGYLAACLATYGIPKVTSIIRRL